MFALPSVRGLPRAYWALWLGTLVNRMGSFVVPFLMIYLTDERGLSVVEAGHVIAIYGAGSLSAGVVGGFLSDRIGRRRTMIFGYVVGASIMALLAIAREPWLLALATFFLALTGDLSRPAVWAAVTDLVPERDRPRAYGFLYWAINLGFACAPLIAGRLSSLGFTLLFIGDALTTLACAAIVVMTVPETRPAARKGERHVTIGESLAPFRDPVFMAFGFAWVLVALAFQQCFSSLPVDMRAHGHSPETYGDVLSLNGWLIVLVQPFAVGFVTRFPPYLVLAASSAITGIGMAIPAFDGSTSAYAASVLVWTVGEIAMAPVSPLVVASLSPVRLRGSYQGSQQVFWGAAAVLAPELGPAIIAHSGAPTLWLVCFATSIATGLIYLGIAGAAKRRAAALAEEESALAAAERAT